MKKKILVIVTLFILVSVILSVLMYVQSNIMDGVRAYVRGEGLYAKGQKDAVFYLQNYSKSNNPKEYDLFEESLAIPLGDRKARMALQSSEPDLTKAYEGFLQGKNHPEDIQNLIRFFLHFKNFPYMREAVRIWTEGDANIVRLRALGSSIKAALEHNDTSDLFRNLDELYQLNRVLASLENEFSLVLSQGSRWIKTTLTRLGFVMLAFLILLALLITKRILKEIQQIEDDLRVSNNRFRTLFESNMLGIFDWQRDGTVTDANQAFLEMIGFEKQDVDQNKICWREITPQESVPNDMKALTEINEKGYCLPYEKEYFHKDGRRIPVLCGGALLEGNEEKGIAFVLDQSESKAAADEIRKLAFYDPLTGLANRRLLMDRIKHALAASARTGKRGALIYLDLDQFKTLNDTLGHDVGDLLLQQVGERLLSCVREEDTVARLGGDEFVVLLENLSKQLLEAGSRIKTVGSKIMSVLERSYQLGPHHYRCTPSIGVTLFHSHDETAEELLKQADIAMYQSKKAGRNQLHFFDPKMQANINARAMLEDDLRQALEKQQFQLYYQPQIKSYGQITGAEALIRWTHPQLGMILPARFIPLSEETNIILPMGRWVLETACAQLKAWQREERTRDLSLAVNVSPKQFRQLNFVDQVTNIVRHYGIEPKLLKLELTESLLVDDVDKVITTMNTLNQMGIQFSLDDFGTGYSSLQYLKHLPLDQLKIDRSFIRDISSDSEDEAIISTIIVMANSLGLEVIAEGVETDAQRRFLLARGCQYYQGYLFGKPMPIEQFDHLLELRKGRTR